MLSGEGEIYLRPDQDQINEARAELRGKDEEQSQRHQPQRLEADDFKEDFLKDLPKTREFEGMLARREELSKRFNALLESPAFQEHIRQIFSGQKSQITRDFLSIDRIRKSDQMASDMWASIQKTFVDEPVASSDSTDSLGILVGNLRVPDVLFDQGEQNWHQLIGRENKFSLELTEAERTAPQRIWILNAAHKQEPGGAYYKGNAMEEALYQQSDLTAHISEASYQGVGLQAFGGTQTHLDATAFETQVQEGEEGVDFTGNTASFNMIDAAGFDLRHGQEFDASTREQFFATDEGQSEFFKLNFTNYFKTIEHVVQQYQKDKDEGGVVQKPVCYLTALGCGLFANPNFLVAAAARLAIEKATEQYGADEVPAFKFAIYGDDDDLSAVERRKTFDRIINDAPLDEVKAMLNPNSKLYYKEMQAFFFDTQDLERRDSLNKLIKQYDEDSGIAISSYPGCYCLIKQRILSIQSQLKGKFDRADKLNLIGRVTSLLVIGGFVAIVLAKASVVLMGIALGTLALGTIGASALQMIYYGSNKAAFGAAGVSGLLLGGSAVGLGYAIGLAKMTAFVTSLVSTILVTPVLAGFSAFLGVVLLFGVIELVKSLSKQCALFGCALFGHNALSLKDSLKHDQSVLACANDFIRAEEGFMQDSSNSRHQLDGRSSTVSASAAERGVAPSSPASDHSRQSQSVDAVLSEGFEQSSEEPESLGAGRSSSVLASTEHDEPSSQEPQAPSSSASPRV